MLLLIPGVWFLVLRPQLHTFAKDQTGQVLTGMINEVNPLFTALTPAGIPLPVSESLINQALVVPASSWFTVQDMQLQITPENIQFSFQVHVALFTFACAITSVPKVVNGQIEIQTMTISGPVNLVISADDLKAEVNGYLQQLHERMQRPIAALTLADHLLWITLG